MGGEAPITLQRHCRVKFVVRVEGGKSAESASFESAVSAARLGLKGGAKSVQVDAIMEYEAAAGNKAALAQLASAGAEAPIAKWEIFTDDVVFCPRGPLGLPPDYFKAALELSEDDPRELRELQG